MDEQIRDLAAKIMTNIIHDPEFIWGGIPDESHLLSLGVTSKQAGNIEISLYNTFVKLTKMLDKHIK